MVSHTSRTNNLKLFVINPGTNEFCMSYGTMKFLLGVLLVRLYIV